MLGAVQVKRAMIILNMSLLIMDLKTKIDPNPAEAQYNALGPLFESLTKQRRFAVMTPEYADING